MYLMFSFLSSKRAQVSKTKISKKGRKNLIYLNSHILCGLLSLLPKYFYRKIKCIGATLTVVFFAAVWSRYTTPSILKESALRDETK